MKIKADRIAELEKFGFVPFTNRIHSGYKDRGAASGYRKRIDSGNGIEVITNRKNWKWLSNNELYEIYPVCMDYDAYPSAKMFDEIKDLIKADMVEE